MTGKAIVNSALKTFRPGPPCGDHPAAMGYSMVALNLCNIHVITLVNSTRDLIIECLE